MLNDVLQIVSEQLDVPEGSLNGDSAFDNVEGWDSLGTMRIALAMEERYEISLSMEEILKFDSVKAISVILETKRCLGEGIS